MDVQISQFDFNTTEVEFVATSERAKHIFSTLFNPACVSVKVIKSESIRIYDLLISMKLEVK